jgi:hypothetical protein
MLYNSHKQLITSGDAYPSKWFAKVRLGLVRLGKVR